MPGDTVLIAAYSARALAEAARRAGYVPLVADIFGDDDTRAAAEIYLRIESETGDIRARPLLAALDALREAAPQKPLGLVLGSGFEDKPRLMTELDRRFGLIGTSPATVVEVKHPLRLDALLRRLAVPHPETRADPPQAMDGWLSKRQGATGGGHVRRASARDTGRRRRYFQRELGGESYSLLTVVSPDQRRTWLSSQWVSAAPAAPFRYGGAVTAHAAPLMASMFRSASAILDALPFRGLVSFDFRIDRGAAYLLEINPRPGATLDNFDHPNARLFAAHVRAHLEGTFEPPPPFADAVATAILYAQSRALTIPAIAWPEWASDRTPRGKRIGPFEPIATVKASAETPDTAKQRALTRLASLEDLLYESAEIAEK